MISDEVWARARERMRPIFLCRLVQQDGIACAEMVSPVSIPVESPRTVYELKRHENLHYFGRIAFWSFTYGFIQLLDGTRVYIHQSDCSEALDVGTLLRFELEHVAAHDRFKAYNCTVIDIVPHVYIVGETPVLPTLGNSLHDLRAMGCNFPLGTCDQHCIRPYGRYIFVRDLVECKKTASSPSQADSLGKQTPTRPSSTSECASSENENVTEPGEIVSDVVVSEPVGTAGRFERKRCRDDSSDED